MRDGPASTNPHRQNTASPGYAGLCRARAKPLSIIVACCTLVATSYSESILAFLNQFASIYSFSFFVMLFALMLPGRLFLLTILLAAGALDALSRVNQLKISSVFLPITFFDVGMVISDPSVLVNALGIRDSFYRMVFIAVGLIGFALAVSIFYRIWCYSFPDRLKLSRSCGQTGTQSSCFLLNILALVFILIAAPTCLGRYGRFVHAHLTTQASNLGLVLWLPSSQVTLSRELGVLEYMAFSFAANEKADIFLEHEAGRCRVRQQLCSSLKSALAQHRIFPCRIDLRSRPRFQTFRARQTAFMVQTTRDEGAQPSTCEHHRRRKLGHGIRGDHRSRLQNLRVPRFLHPFLHRAESEKLFRRVSGKEGIQDGGVLSCRRQFL